MGERDPCTVAKVERGMALPSHSTAAQMAAAVSIAPVRGEGVIVS